MTDLETYQTLAAETDVYSAEFPDFIDAQELRLALGVAGEAGEIIEKYKKAIREEDESYLDDVHDEMGDVMWYMARLAVTRGDSLEEIAEDNIIKLTDRKMRGVITGEGDNR